MFPLFVSLDANPMVSRGVHAYIIHTHAHFCFGILQSTKTPNVSPLYSPRTLNKDLKFSFHARMPKSDANDGCNFFSWSLGIARSGPNRDR